MILAVGRDETLRRRVTSGLAGTRWAGPVAGASSTGEAQQLLAARTPPQVVIVDESIGVERAGEIAATAIEHGTRTTVLLVGDPTTDLLRRAMRAGIRDVLPRAFTDEHLIRALTRSGVGTDGPAALPGTTVSVFSTKGGVGTSVVAANLAARLEQRTSAGTTLMDLDLASADQAIMHGVAPTWTIQDLADGRVGTDQESLDQVLVRAGASAVRLLGGPVDPALAETITAGQVEGIITAVRSVSPIAVLDTASSFDDRTLSALDASDTIIVVSSLDVAALRALSVSLQTMARLGIDNESIVIAVVRADSKSGLLVSDVEHAISRPVDVGIPSTRAVPRSVNEGVPLVVSSPKSSMVAAIDGLVERVLARSEAEFSADDGARGSLLPWGRRQRVEASVPPEGRDRSRDANDAKRQPIGPDAAPMAGGTTAPLASETGSPATAVEPVADDRQPPPTSDGPQRRAVRRRPAQGGAVQPALEPTIGGDADEERTPDRLAEMPPPTVLVDEVTDKSRRRRRG